MSFVDAHTHLHFPSLAGSSEEKAAKLVAALRDRHVRAAVVNSTRPTDWAQVAALSRRHPDFVIPAFGLHPWYVADAEIADHWDETLRSLLAKHPEAAVGEIGLDKAHNPRQFEAQERIFRRQMELAAEFDRAACIHCVRAWGPLCDILESAGRPKRGFLMHAYGGSVELIDRLSALGAYFSFPASILFEDNRGRREALLAVPADRLLLETDAPNLPPPPGLLELPLGDEEDLLNHPVNIVSVYTGAAKLLGRSLGDLEKQVEENFTRLFGQPR